MRFAKFPCPQAFQLPQANFKNSAGIHFKNEVHFIAKLRFASYNKKSDSEKSLSVSLSNSKGRSDLYFKVMGSFVPFAKISPLTKITQAQL